MHDYITVLLANKPCNKTVSLQDGKILKQAGAPITLANAKTIHVPEVDTMAQLLREISERPNAAIIGGYIAGTEDGKQFQILSSSQLGDGYNGGWRTINGVQSIGRLRKNFSPSSWWQIDRDRAVGLPVHLNPDTEDGYIDLVSQLLPDFKTAGFVRLASTTGRVCHQGQPLDSTGSRYWFQVKNPSEIDGFGNRLKLHGASQGLGFMKYDKNGKGVLWGICDCSVFSPERLAFDGKPSVSADFTLREPDIRIQQGGKVNATIIPPDAATRDALRSQFNIEITSSGNVVTVTNNDYLTLDTAIEISGRGTKTVKEFFDSGDERWRCQATFRDSSSWNAAFKLDNAGYPYLHDFGGETLYRLTDAEQNKLFEEIFHVA